MGLSQDETAAKVGISLSGYAQIEYGKSWPTPTTLESLAKTFKVTEADLLTDHSKKMRAPAALINELTNMLPFLSKEQVRAIISLIKTK